MTNLKRTTQRIGLPAALMLALALPGGAEPAWKKVQGKLAGQKQESDAQAGEAATAAAGADDPEVQAMKAKAAEEARENPSSVQEVPVEGQPAEAEDPSGTIGLPTAGASGGTAGPQINLGKEGEDNAAVKNVFTDPQFLKMIGDKPVFIYNAVDKPDPMVFPPIRIAAIYLECITQADTLLQEAGYTGGAKGARVKPGTTVDREKIIEAVAALNKARALNDARYIPQIDKRLREIGDFVGILDAGEIDKSKPKVEPVVPTPVPKDPELPVEISEATTGVIAAGDMSFCLIGDSLLKVGDVVPSYPDVTVSAIAAGSVTFTVRQNDKAKDFPVEVKGYDDLGDVSQLSSGSRDRGKRSSGRRR